tara:strand:- start:33085 stop:33927 length:843 start_codon:yes stop_codon:yes gene_type:complete
MGKMVEAKTELGAAVKNPRVESQIDPVPERQRPARSILEHLVAQPAIDLGDDHLLFFQFIPAQSLEHRNLPFQITGFREAVCRSQDFVLQPRNNFLGFFNARFPPATGSYLLYLIWLEPVSNQFRRRPHDNSKIGDIPIYEGVCANNGTQTDTDIATNDSIDSNPRVTFNDTSPSGKFLIRIFVKKTTRRNILDVMLPRTNGNIVCDRDISPDFRLRYIASRPDVSVVSYCGFPTNPASVHDLNGFIETRFFLFEKTDSQIGILSNLWDINTFSPGSKRR